MSLPEELARRAENHVVMPAGADEMRAVLALLREAEGDRDRLARLLVEYTTFPPCAKGSEFVDDYPFGKNPLTCKSNDMETLGGCGVEWVRKKRGHEARHG